MSVTIGKAELVTRLADEAELSKKQAEAALNGFLSVVTAALENGEEVAIKDFGKFALSISAAREGRNPQDPSQALKIAPAVHVRFKPGRAFAEAVNGKKTVEALAKANKDSKDIQDRAKAWKDTHK